MENNSLPRFYPVKFDEISLEDYLINAEDFSKVNEALIKTALSLRDVNKKLDDYTRDKAKAELEYKNSYRKAYLTHNSAKTEAQRKILAEFDCREYEIEIQYLTAYIDVLNRKAYELRSELDVIKTVGHNLRQEWRSI